MSNNLETLGQIINPLDSIEDILANQDWVYDRLDENELSVHVGGKHGHYKVSFVWEKEYNAMQFCCEYDLFVPKDNMESASRAIMALNASLWIGHFCIPDNSLTPAFRHTCLFHGLSPEASADQIEDLIEVALNACELHHGVFSLLANDSFVNDGHLNLALMNAAGEA